MAVILTREDYEGLGDNPAYRDLYSTSPPYRDGPWVTQRGDRMRTNLTAGKTLVAGCGYGYLTKYLNTQGFDAYGCDLSDWAVSQAATVVPGRVMKADITNAVQLSDVKIFAGLKGRSTFTTTITEDILTCLTDAEINAALRELRAISQVVVHIVTAVELPNTQRDPRFNWKTLAAWKAIVGNEYVMGVETQAIL